MKESFRESETGPQSRPETRAGRSPVAHFARDDGSATHQVVSFTRSTVAPEALAGVAGLARGRPRRAAGPETFHALPKGVEDPEPRHSVSDEVYSALGMRRSGR